MLKKYEIHLYVPKRNLSVYIAYHVDINNAVYEQIYLTSNLIN
jgi:hypothetical protein